MRVRKEERQMFSPFEKSIIKDKSDGRCCHCGVCLSYNFTIDHVIPLDKGGSNDMGNLVALCVDCNKDKGNYIVEPKGYFKYLKPLYLDEVLHNQEKYYKEVNWLTPTNFIPEDVKKLECEFIPPKMSVEKYKSMRKRFGTTYYDMYRASYEDLDDIYHFVLKYNKKYGSEYSASKDYVKDAITTFFTSGVLYLVRNKARDVIAVIPMGLDRISIPKEYGDYDESNYIFSINNIAIMRNDLSCATLIEACYKEVIQDLFNLDIYDDYLVVKLTYNVNNLMTANYFEKIIRGYSVLESGERHGFTDYVSVFKRAYNADGSSISALQTVDDKNKVAKVINSFSRALEEKMFLENTDELKDFDYEVDETGIDSNCLFFKPLSQVRVLEKFKLTPPSPNKLKEKREVLKNTGKVKPLVLNNKFEVVDNYTTYILLKEQGYYDVPCVLKEGF